MALYRITYKEKNLDKIKTSFYNELSHIDVKNRTYYAYASSGILLKVERVENENVYNFWRSDSIRGFIVWLSLIITFSWFLSGYLNILFIIIFVTGGLISSESGIGWWPASLIMNFMQNKYCIFTELSDEEIQKIIDKNKPSDNSENYSSSKSKTNDYSANSRDVINTKDKYESAYENRRSELVKEMMSDDKIQEIKNSPDKKDAFEKLISINMNENPDWLKGADYSDKQIEKVATDFEIKEQKKLANHNTFEGRINATDKKKLKSAFGCECMACGKNMENVYGSIGKNYIELHHKIPYADMQENDDRILTADDFCVLCPDCHKMIHKLDDAGNIKLLKDIIELNKK